MVRLPVRLLAPVCSLLLSPPQAQGRLVDMSTADAKPWQCGNKAWKQPLTLPALTDSLHGSLHMGIMYGPASPIEL